MQTHSWVWAVLPPGSGRIQCIGSQPDLARELREIDHLVSEGALPGDVDGTPPADAVMIAGADAGAASSAIRAAKAGSVSAIAIPAEGETQLHAPPVPRAFRALELAVSPLVALSNELGARRLERAMRDAGLNVTRMRTGDRSRARYGLGSGGWLERRRVPVGSIVIATSGERPPSVVDEAIRRAAEALGRPLRWRSGTVFESGKLALELVDRDRRRYFLSLAAGRAGAGLDRSGAAIAAVLATDPPAAVRDRIVERIAEGRIGSVRWVLEPKALGRHPALFGPELWDDCFEFLVALHQLAGPDGEPPALPSAYPDLDTAVALLEPHAHPGDVLVLVRSEIERRLEGVPRGGGHGDVWSGNLIARAGRLRAVLDWEWASADSLAVLDLMELRAQLGLRRSRGRPPGSNLMDVLWPLAQAGGDRMLRRYCQATRTPADRATLEGLAMAHWLLRTARATTIRPQRLASPAWLERNLRAPLALLEAELRPARRPSAPPGRPRPDASAARRPSSREPVRARTLILAYHAISDVWPASLAVRTRELERQLRLLVAWGYRGVTFSEALVAPPGEKVLAITFDDGYRSILERAFPMMQRLGLPGTAFVPTAFAERGSFLAWPGIDHWLDGPFASELDPMSWDELATLADAGWEIGSHTRTHQRLPTLADDELEHELTASRRECEAHLGVPCRSLAYPFGAHDDRVVAAAAACGYEAACALSTGGDEPLRYRRIGIHRRDHRLRFVLKVSPRIQRLRNRRGWNAIESAIGGHGTSTYQ